MKRLFLSIFVTLALTGLCVACPTDGESAPEVVVETVDESVDTTLEVANQYIKNLAAPIARKIGPQASSILRSFPYALNNLRSLEIDTTEFEKLGESAATHFNDGRVLFKKGNVYSLLGDMLASEAEEADGTKVYALKTKAAACYYEAAVYLEQARAELESVIKIGNEAKELYKKLNPPETVEPEIEPEVAPAVNRTTGRYHLRKRTARFFS